MSSPQEYRLYTFVANLYLSPLQCGLQTAHVVSEISSKMDQTVFGADGVYITSVFSDWARYDKTIIICGALNHGGVKDCWAELERLSSELELPAAIFHEDEVSMNGMATACGVVVPKHFWNTTFVPGDSGGEGPGNYMDAYEYIDERGYVERFPVTEPEGQFIAHIKKYRLA